MVTEMVTEMGLDSSNTNVQRDKSSFFGELHNASVNRGGRRMPGIT